MAQPQTEQKTDSTVQVLITVTAEDGTKTPEVVDVDLDLSNPTLQEAVIWEEELGEEAMKQLLAGEMKIDTPKKVRTFLYGRLKRRYPSLSATDFDLDIETLTSVLS